MRNSIALLRRESRPQLLNFGRITGLQTHKSLKQACRVSRPVDVGQTCQRDAAIGDGKATQTRNPRSCREAGSWHLEDSGEARIHFVIKGTQMCADVGRWKVPRMKHGHRVDTVCQEQKGHVWLELMDALQPPTVLVESLGEGRLFECIGLYSPTHDLININPVTY